MLNSLTKGVKSYKSKRLLHNVLKYPVFTRNPLYSRLYLLKVKNEINKLERKPSVVTIENTNICNISCIFCANEQMTRKKGHINKSLFEDITRQCVKEKIPNLLIQGFGEPLLDKEYVSKVEFAKNLGIKSVHCVTNGVLLKKEVSNGLIKAGLDLLYISIDAVTKNTYSKIHRTPINHQPFDKFDIITQNIKELFKLKKKYNSQKPWVQVRFKDFEENKGELQEFIRKYSNVVDDINIYMNITNWPGSNVENDLPKGAPLLKFPCRNLWSTLYITHNGKVALCCQDYECKVEIGDVNNQSVMDIWRSKKLKKIRNMHMKTCFDKIPVCKDCVVNTHYVNPWWF